MEKVGMSKEDIKVFRRAISGIFEGEGDPVDIHLGSGLYIGFYPTENNRNIGVGYVYIADPTYHFDGPAPDDLQNVDNELSKVSRVMRSIICDVTGNSYRLTKKKDENGGMYYAAEINLHPNAESSI